MFNFIKKIFTQKTTNTKPTESNETNIVRVPFTEEVSLILLTLRLGPKGLRELSREINIPKDTLSRRLKKLLELGVIKVSTFKNKLLYRTITDNIYEIKLPNSFNYDEFKMILLK